MPSASGQLLWTGPAGGSWSSSANWIDPVNHKNYAPTSTDQLLLDPAAPLHGANTSGIINTSMTVDRVIMDSSYTATVTVPSGITLSTTNYFQQYGTLAMVGTGTITAGTYFNIYGAVTALSSGGATAHLNTTGSFFLFTSGSITVLGGPAPPLSITTGNFSDSGTISVGTGAGPGNLTITGAFLQSAGATTLTTGSVLTFASGGSPSAYPIIQGSTTTVTMSGATISTDTKLAISGATLNCLTTAGNVIAGNLAVYNTGIINVGSPLTGTTAHPSTLTLTTGSFTVGALDPNSGGTGGTLNLYTKSLVTFPPASGSSTFVVKSLGVINMYGASIAMTPSRVAFLDIRAAEPGLSAGTLNSLSAPSIGVGDSVTGSIVCAGVINMGNGGTAATALAVSLPVTVSGALNMSGATLTVPSLTLSGGTLTSQGGTGFGDTIMTPGGGGLTNNGMIQYSGALHTLALAGAGAAYTQGTQGTLIFRVGNGSVNDVFTISGAATLAGTLTITAVGTLTAGQMWDLILAGVGITTDFTTKNFPADGNPNWDAASVGGIYFASN